MLLSKTELNACFILSLAVINIPCYFLTGPGHLMESLLLSTSLSLFGIIAYRLYQYYVTRNLVVLKSLNWINFGLFLLLGILYLSQPVMIFESRRAYWAAQQMFLFGFLPGNVVLGILWILMGLSLTPKYIVVGKEKVLVQEKRTEKVIRLKDVVNIDFTSTTVVLDTRKGNFILPFFDMGAARKEQIKAQIHQGYH